ncbi:hypothetical protein SSX86_012898 [Deinandra increscens subsp. villosa]|uniref:Uncharacterized protein n=1 Tax=Deinandra increscens subsp. villosa TaxID=3103831 RepID=A0AAP0D9K6_9ASTR
MEHQGKESGDSSFDHVESHEPVTSGGTSAVGTMPGGRGYGRGQYSQGERVVGKGFGRAHVIRQQRQQEPVQSNGISVDHSRVTCVGGALSMYIENAKIMRSRRDDKLLLLMLICSPMEAVDASEVLRVLDSSLSRTNWRLRAASKLRLQTDILALCTGMRPVIMIDYGGKMPELRERLCAFLKFSQEESSIFENLRVMVIEDMLYLIHISGLVELVKLTINKELELHFVDLEHDPPKMITEVEKISIGAQFISLQKLFFEVFCDDATTDNVSACQLRVNNQSSGFIDLSRFMQDTSVTVPTLNGWLLGYPVVYIFGKEHIQDAVYNLSTKSLNLFNIFVCRNSTSSEKHPQEELMSFSVPYDLSMDGEHEVWAGAFLARMKTRWEKCKHVWGSLRMESYWKLGINFDYLINK